MVEIVLTTLANESVARCMEALFRSDNDVDPAPRHSNRRRSIHTMRLKALEDEALRAPLRSERSSLTALAACGDGGGWPAVPSLLTFGLDLILGLA